MKTVTLHYYPVRGTRADCLAMLTYRGKRLASHQFTCSLATAETWARNTTRALYGAEFTHCRTIDTVHNPDKAHVSRWSLLPKEG